MCWRRPQTRAGRGPARSADPAQSLLTDGSGGIRTMVMRAFVGGLAMVALAGAAAATPGDPFDSGHDAAPLTILDPATGTPCPQKPGICITAAARSTIAVASAPMAAAAGSADKSSKAA